MPSRPTEVSAAAGFPSSFKYTPLQHVRELYVGFAQGLFGSAPVGCYHWATSPDESEIYISDENPVKTSVAGTRPALSFTRGAVQFYSLGLDDLLKYNLENNQKEKSVLVPGTMTINCLSRVDIECENLAWVIAEHLWLLRDSMMKLGFFEVGRQPVIGAPSPAGTLVSGDGADEWYATSVTCPFQFYRTSRFTPLGLHIVQGIQATLRTQLEKLNKPGPPSASGRPDLPYQIDAVVPPPFSVASDANGGSVNPGGSAPSLPRVPHPLNPSQLVTVRPVDPYRPGLRPASIGGRPIPLSSGSVEQSEPQVPMVSTVKV